MNKTKSFCICAMLSAAVLCSCGKKEKIDYDVEENVNTNTDAAASALGDIDTDENWQQEFDVVSSGYTKQVKIAAPVSVPETSGMCVVDVEQPVFDSSYKKNIAQKIFGNNPVYIYGMESPTKAELEEKLEDLPDTISSLYDLIEEYQDDDFNEGKYVQSLYDEIDFYTEKLDEYEGMLDTAPENHVETSGFEERNYMAQRDGVNYVLSFDTGEDDPESFNSDFYWDDPVKYMHISLEAEDYADICPEKLSGLSDVSCWYYDEALTDAENACLLTEEEAQNMAASFISDLGFSYLEVASVEPLIWEGYYDGETEARTAVDGYKVNFEYSINGVSASLNNWDYYSYQLAADSEGSYCAAPSAYVLVNDKGIIGMDISNPIVIKKVTENVPLLSLDSIKEIMVNELSENFDTYVTSETGTSVYRFYEMKLMYFRLKDDSDSVSYSYVPAWRLSKTSNYSTEEYWLESCIMVNAIDGSVIDVGKEMFTGCTD